MTEEELTAIEERTKILFDLVDECGRKQLGWRSEHAEVHAYLTHLDKHFPGKDVYALVAEVRTLQAVFGDRMQDEPALAEAYRRGWAEGAEAMREAIRERLDVGSKWRADDTKVPMPPEE